MFLLLLLLQGGARILCCSISRTTTFRGQPISLQKQAGQRTPMAQTLMQSLPLLLLEVAATLEMVLQLLVDSCC